MESPAVVGDSIFVWIIIIIIEYVCINRESAGESLSIVNDSFSHALISFVSSVCFVTLTH